MHTQDSGAACKTNQSRIIEARTLGVLSVLSASTRCAPEVGGGQRFGVECERLVGQRPEGRVRAGQAAQDQGEHAPARQVLAARGAIAQHLPRAQGPLQPSDPVSSVYGHRQPALCQPANTAQRAGIHLRICSHRVSHHRHEQSAGSLGWKVGGRWVEGARPGRRRAPGRRGHIRGRCRQAGGLVRRPGRRPTAPDQARPRPACAAPGSARPPARSAARRSLPSPSGRPSCQSHDCLFTC